MHNALTKRMVAMRATRFSGRVVKCTMRLLSVWSL
jgi:hypothetical protein